jgi:hypothetical protein
MDRLDECLGRVCGENLSMLARSDLHRKRLHPRDVLDFLDAIMLLGKMEELEKLGIAKLVPGGKSYVTILWKLPLRI